MKYSFIVLSLLFVGCAQFEAAELSEPAAPVAEAPVPEASPAPTATPAVVDVEQQDIDLLVSAENDYRLTLGQTMLSPGLSCTVQQVSAGNRISSSSPSGLGPVVTLTGPAYGYLLTDTINQPNTNSGLNNVIPAPLRPIFASMNHLIRCQGQLVVRETAYHKFNVSSDDGSILTVNGTQVINNDGNHGVVAKTGTILLRRGVVSIKLEYAQTGGGNLALVLNHQDALINSKLFQH